MQDNLLVMDTDLSGVGAVAYTPELDFGDGINKGGTPRRASVRFTLAVAFAGTAGIGTLGYETSSVAGSGHITGGTVVVPDLTALSLGDTVEIPINTNEMRQYVRAFASSAAGPNTGEWAVDIIAG